MEKAKVCPYCGRKISVYTKRCIYCGRILEKQCPHCLEYVQIEAKRCRFCGQSLPIPSKEVSKPEALGEEVPVRPTKPVVAPPTKHMRRLIKIGIPIVAAVCLLVLVFLIILASARRKAKSAILNQLAKEGYIICDDLAIKATDIYTGYYRGERRTEVWVKVRNLSEESILVDAAHFALVMGDQKVKRQQVKEPYSLHNKVVAAGQGTSAAIFFDYVELKAETIPTAISLIFKDKWRIPLKGFEVD